jgi:hypothetical protein
METTLTPKTKQPRQFNMNLSQLNQWKIAASLICMASLTFANVASAATLLTDNFNVVSGNSQNVNQDLAVRQAGSLALATYTGIQDHHQVGNTGTDVGQPGGASNSGYVLLALNGRFQSDVDIARASTGPLIIEVDMYNNGSNPGGGGSGQWVAFALRREGQTFPVAGGGEFGFLKRASGGVQVFQNGGGVAPGSWDTAGFATANHWTLTFTDTAGTGSAFVGNGSKVTFMNGATTLGTLTLSQLNRSGLKLGFQCDGNRFAGIDNIAISGTLPAIAVTGTNQSGGNPFTPSWTPETPNLIAGLSPTTASGNFTQEGAGGTPVLTDSTIGTSGTIGGFATCGANAGNTLIYTLTNSINGSDVTNIVVYSGWGDGGRHGQYYDVSYSTVSAPTTYIPIATVFYLPGSYSGAPANRVTIAKTNGTALGSAVANIKFDFSSPPQSGSFNNAYHGYSEIIVQGSDTAAPPPPPSPYLTQDTLPTRAETVVGDQVVFTAAYSNSPPANVQWLFISGGVTNTIAGATGETLTLNNVQLTNSGTYTLKAVNATNPAAAPSYSTPAPLVVGTAGTVGNVIVKYAGQVGPYPFYPTWSVDTNIDLVFGFPTDGSGNPGTATAGGGNFGVEAGLNGDPTILADGILGNTLALMNSCGPGAGSGKSMTYTLNTIVATNGFDLTNITIYGGWPDTGRNEQKYQVLYSTVAAPAVFSSIGTFNYNPTFGGGVPNANRVILVSLTGALAQNVHSIQINWDLQGSQPKNGWEGYSEVSVNGAASAPRPVLTADINPLTAADVVGSSLTLSAGFSGATSYQWQKNGTNISGANSATLTLSNLQLSDTATNGGYRLVAANGAGTSVTRGCSLVVSPVPAAVNNAIVAFANQTGDAATFTTTWDTSAFASSLISGAAPSDFGPGNFTDPDGNPASFNLAGGLPVLTDGDYGSTVNGGTHPAYATCGPTAGQYVVFTLPPNANGYDLTNILIASGWNDDGRNANWSTISYSTATNPAMFFPIAVVTNRPTLGTKSQIRATLTPAAGVLAANVYAIKVDFEFPEGIPNGYSGFSQINVLGAASAAPAPAAPVITVQHEENSTTWTVETPNLIANQLPSSQGSGVFTGEGCNVTNLTDGILGFGAAFGAACGTDPGASVSSITFNSGAGWDLTNIVVYTLWHDFGREGQFYHLSYSTLSAPTTFLPLASVAYNPFVIHDGRDSGNRVAITPAMGQTLLASNVAAVKFDFTLQGSQDFSWSGYTEIVLQGSNLAAPAAPVLNPVTVSGGSLILTGTGAANYGYTVITTTNLLTPQANWTVSATGVTDGAGVFSNSVPVGATDPSRFFRVRMP